jgi:hypothetical protein
MRMPDSIRGFKVTDIVDRLTLDVLRLLEQVLTASRFEQDRLYLGLLLTLSRKTYVNKLLFRDFSAAGESQWYSLPMPDGTDAKVHEQSVTYLQQVLARRPRLARRLQHEPGNMHLLLGALCRFGPAEKNWAIAEVKRDQTLEKDDGAQDFRIPLGRALEALCRSLGTDYSPATASLTPANSGGPRNARSPVCGRRLPMVRVPSPVGSAPSLVSSFVGSAVGSSSVPPQAVRTSAAAARAAPTRLARVVRIMRPPAF